MILLVRTPNESSAQIAVEDLSKDFMILGDEGDLCNLESFSKRNTEFGFADQTFLATFDDPSNNRATSILVTSYGSTYMLVVSRYGVANDLDVDSHCLSVQFVGRMQLEKLMNAGYTK